MFKPLDLKKFALQSQKNQAIQDWVNLTVDCQRPFTLTDEPTIIWKVSCNYNAEVTLKGNRILLIVDAKIGTYGTIKIVQDSTGSRTLTLPSWSKVANAGAGALTLTSAANSIDIASFYYDGINYFWTLSNDFT